MIQSAIPETVIWNTPPATPPPLDDAVVHVWQMTLSQPENVIPALKATLSADERARMARLNQPSAREKFAITRGLLRATLAYHLQISPAELRFNYLPQGKPMLACPDVDVRFNLSHSGELLVCAVTIGRQVGVDVEWMRTMRQMEKFAARFYSPQENEWLANTPEAEKARVFFSIWTGKEAYLKGCGDGITRQLRDISVVDVAGENLCLSAADRPEDVGQWVLMAFEPAPGAIGALAVAGRGWQTMFWQWDDLTPK